MKIWLIIFVALFLLGCDEEINITDDCVDGCMKARFGIRNTHFGGYIWHTGHHLAPPSDEEIKRCLKECWNDCKPSQ